MTVKKTLLLLSLAAVFAACSSSDDPVGDEPQVQKGSLTVSPATIELTDNSASRQTLSLTANTTWRASSSADWCKFSPEQGTATSKQITVDVEMNTSKSERTCTLTVEAIDGTAKATVTVKQPGKDSYRYTSTNSNAPTGMQKNASAIMQSINVGWNLGNTLESDGADWYTGPNVEMETTWGNPMTTEAMIRGVKAAGFNAIRIPTRWYNHADDGMNVSAEWMARVKEVVDYAIDNGLYVILNSHHDNWYDRIDLASFNETDVDAKFTSLWTQIANTFKDYDEHLVLAGTNEVIEVQNGNEQWNAPATASVYATQNKLNQLFVDAVRATGGNNAWRVLAVQSYASSPDCALTDFVKPTDTVADRLMLEFHYYQPYAYCAVSNNEWDCYYWGSPYSAYKPFCSSGEADITSMFDRLQTQFVDAGLPVVMGEFGAERHHQASDLNAADESRAYYLEYVVREAKNHGFAGFFWDNNVLNAESGNFGLLDRSNAMKPYVQSAVDAILKGAADGVYPY